MYPRMSVPDSIHPQILEEIAVWESITILCKYKDVQIMDVATYEDSYI